MISANGKQNKQQQVLNNKELARCLEDVAELLEAQDANPYRVLAYRTAATTLRDLDRPVDKILEAEGLEGLIRLPGIGQSIARSLEQLVHTGKLNLLERLRGTTDPERVLTTVPTIGPGLAHRLHEQLGIETLAELQASAYDGRLAQVPGFGRKRIRAVRESLTGRLYRRPAVKHPRRTYSLENQPPISELLDVDREYRQKAKVKQLPRIAPRRFNPTHEAWLPILHTERGTTHYTALFSNTARAHELDMIQDWVVIYRDDQDGNGQWTVVTSQFGPLRGQRIVRGRETECQAYYHQHTETTASLL